MDFDSGPEAGEVDPPRPCDGGVIPERGGLLQSVALNPPVPFWRGLKIRGISVPKELLWRCTPPTPMMVHARNLGFGIVEKQVCLIIFL